MQFNTHKTKNNRVTLKGLATETTTHLMAFMYTDTLNPIFFRSALTRGGKDSVGKLAQFDHIAGRRVPRPRAFGAGDTVRKSRGNITLEQ